MGLFTLTAQTLAGPGYIILNIIRAVNVIALLSVIISSIVLVVKTVMASQLYFFDGASHFVTVFVSVFLIISELPLFRHYYAIHWPVLSPSHGFTALGLAMIAIGVEILANLNRSTVSAHALGRSIWSSVIGSGIICFALGFVNIIASFVFCDRKHHVTARQVRAKGAVAIALGIADHPSAADRATTKSASSTISSVNSSAASTYKSASIIESQPVQPAPEKPVHEAYWRFEPSTAPPTRRPSPVPSSHYSDRNSGGYNGAVGLPVMLSNNKLGYLVRPETAFHPARK